MLAMLVQPSLLSAAVLTWAVNIHPLGATPAEHLGKVGTNFSISSSLADGV